METRSKEEWLKFILRFAQLDLEKLRQGDRLNLEEDLSTLVRKQDLAALAGVAKRNFEELLQLQRDCRKTLESIPEEPGKTVSRRKLEISTGFEWKEGADGPVAAIFGQWREVFLLKFLLLLGEEGAKRIKRCAECNAFYYREHAAQRSCSNRCARRNYMRHYRESLKKKDEVSKEGWIGHRRTKAEER